MIPVLLALVIGFIVGWVARSFLVSKPTPWS